MTNETTPDAVEQAIASLVNVLVNECSHTSETASALDVCLANLRHARHAERARHADEVAALRGQLGRFERARHDLDRLVQYVLENEDVENPSDVAALMSAGIVEHLLAVLNQEAPGD